MRWRLLLLLGFLSPLFLAGAVADSQDHAVGWCIDVPCPRAVIDPVVHTDPVTNITTIAAILHGNLSSLGDATEVNVSFEWGKSTLLGENTTPEARSAAGLFNATLLNLDSATDYYFRARADGNNNTTAAYGLIRSFRTEAVPTIFDSLLPVGLAIAGFLIIVGLYAMTRRGGHTMGQLLVFIGGLALIYTGFDYQIAIGDAQIALMIAVSGLAVVALSSIEMVQSYRR